MKNAKFYLGLVLSLTLMTAVTTVFISCSDDDDEPSALNLTALTAGGKDLNGATSPTDVPVDATIIATFSTAVDATTATDANITLERDYDNTMLDIDIAVSGSTITITPAADFGTGTAYTLSISNAVKSTEGIALTAALTRGFTTVGTFSPTGVIAHWTFENNADDVVGSYDATAAQIVDITYADSRNAAAGKAASFNGTTSIIEISNGDELIDTQDFTLSFWMKTADHTDNVDKGHFVMGLGAFYGFQFEVFGGYGGWKMPVGYEFNNNGTIGWAAEDNAFNGDGKNKDNGGWKGFVFTKDLTGSGGPAALIRNKWVHMVFVYNHATKQGFYYANGEKMREFDFDLWTDDGGVKTDKAYVTKLKYNGTEPDVVNELAFGFVQSRAGTMWDAEPWGGYGEAGANHFKGLLDDIRIFHSALTEQEVSLMYNSEKP